MDSKYQTLHFYLIARCRDGDRRAQNELFKLYAGSMFNICRRMMANDDEAKDVMQDGFIQAFKKLDSLKEEKMFAGWIKKIMINKCLNAINRKKEVEVLEEETMDFSEEETDDGFKEYKINQIMKAIDYLPKGCRTILNLYAFEGYNHQEIASILDVSIATSKAQYSKAKAKIRARLIQQNY